MKMWSYQFKNCQYKDRMVFRLSHPQNKNPMLVRWYFDIESHHLKCSENAVTCSHIHIIYHNSVHEMLYFISIFRWVGNWLYIYLQVGYFMLKNFVTEKHRPRSGQSYWKYYVMFWLDVKVMSCLLVHLQTDNWDCVCQVLISLVVSAKYMENQAVFILCCSFFHFV